MSTRLVGIALSSFRLKGLPVIKKKYIYIYMSITTILNNLCKISNFKILTLYQCRHRQVSLTFDFFFFFLRGHFFLKFYAYPADHETTALIRNFKIHTTFKCGFNSSSSFHLIDPLLRCDCSALNSSL